MAVSKSFSHTIPLSGHSSSSTTRATILRAAWAIVLARYNDNADDIVFGAAVAGRQAPVSGIERMIGPVISTVPVRVRLPRQQSVRQYLRDVQTQGAEMIPYEQTGLQNIVKLGHDEREACGFSTLLVIQPRTLLSEIDVSILVTPSADVPTAAEVDLTTYFTYPLVAQCHLDEDGVVLQLIYDSNVLSSGQLEAMARQYEHVVQQLMTFQHSDASDASLDDISVCGPLDVEQVLQWNAIEPQPTVVNACVHDLISEVASKAPQQEAIFAWDGRCTYGELEQMSTDLAVHLRELGVEAESLVPICFEKSMWTVWRHQWSLIMQSLTRFFDGDTSAHAALTPYVGFVNYARGLDAVRASAYWRAQLQAATRPVFPQTQAAGSSSSSQSLSHKITFPTHSSSSITKATVLRAAWAIVLARYNDNTDDITFGAAVAGRQAPVSGIERMVGPVISTVPVRVRLPRQQPVGQYLRDVQAQGAEMIPYEQTGLQNIAKLGHDEHEACGFSTLLVIQPQLIIRSTTTSLFEYIDSSASVADSSITTGYFTYPLVVQCHLDNDDITLYITYDTSVLCPRQHHSMWTPGCRRGMQLEHRCPDRGRVIVLPHDGGGPGQEAAAGTGHLCLGRRVLLQRAQCGSGPARSSPRRKHGRCDWRSGHTVLREVRVGVCGNAGGQQGGWSLGATGPVTPTTPSPAGDQPGRRFDEGDETDMLLPLDESASRQMSALVGSLSVQLPSYMVPTVYVPVKYMPSTTSQKTDRRRLRAAIDNVEDEEFSRYMLADAVKEAPTTDMETLMQKMWADVLALPVETIGRHDSFLQLGGDSITAIRLVTIARETNIVLTVKMIFDDPRLSHVAAEAAEIKDDNTVHDVQPFSLLPSGEIQTVESELREQCGLSYGQAIEDAYPCTGLQEGLMALAVMQPGSYMAKYVYQLPAHVRLGRFREAWQRSVQLCTNLRTRIATIDGAAVQVLVTNDFAWEATDGISLRSYMATASAFRMGYGSRLCRYGIVENTSEERYFVLTIHHAVFDGWSFGLMMSILRESYDRVNVLVAQPYSRFIQFTKNIDSQAASEYWTKQLRDATRANFPPASNPEKSLNISRIMRTTIPFPRRRDTSITKATILRAAWAVVLARYCDSDDVCFGTTVSGRHAPVFGVDKIIGPTVATVPVRIRLNGRQTVSTMLRQVQAQATEMVAYEQFGLRNISKLSSDAKEACDISSLMIVQPMLPTGDAGETEKEILASPSPGTFDAEELVEGYFTYPLVIQGMTLDDHVELHLTYHANILSEVQLQALSRHFAYVVQQLLAQDERLVSTLSLTGEWDLQQAKEWNVADSTPIQTCVHKIIAQQATRNPEREAIFSSDGSLSYAQLEHMSTQLAIYLSQLGVAPETMVPLCFEKSRWTIVAMLGVMKAGGAFVPIDPSHPKIRRRALIREVNARVMLVSRTTAEDCQGMVDHTVELSDRLIVQLSASTATFEDRQQCDDPVNAAYVIFTSGSTGKPKTIVVEHSALCTSIIGHGRAYHFGEESRVLQFSSYVFDVSLSEILETLSFGGTICVPSELERLQDISGFIERAHVNTALLTSSFVRTLNPAELPSLKTLILVGEPPSKEVIDMWYGHVTLANAYGPSEICIFCTAHVYQSAEEPPSTIGRSFGSNCWIVEVDDYQQLAPIGCIGELVVLRQMARGYLNDLSRTAESFIEQVDWLPLSSQDDTRKFYRTGDLVRYRFDGTIEYIGRRDTQVKIRGYRVELGAIETSIREALPAAENVAVDVVRWDTREALVAFVSFGDNPDREEGGKVEALIDELIPMDDAMRMTFVTLSDDLKASLPMYMVPSLFLPFQRIPLGATMKLDRRRLRTFAEDFTQEMLATFALATHTWVAPTTVMELQLRDVWATVLGISEEMIGKNDNFLQLGGDSITAIRLVAAARAKGIELTVSSIFKDPRLSQVAAAASTSEVKLEELVEPWSLVPEGQRYSVERDVREQCGLATSAADIVSDVYPTTALQEGLMALAMKQPGSYMGRYTFALAASVDLESFKKAWEQTMQACAALRTRIVLSDGQCWQVVVDERPQWKLAHSLTSYIAEEIATPMAYGSALCRFALIAEGKRHFFGMSLHHAVFDGWSMGLIMQVLSHCFEGNALSQIALTPYVGFVQYALGLDTVVTSRYWRAQLQAATRPAFPRAQAVSDPKIASSAATASESYSHKISFSGSSSSSVTKATVLRAAWAIVLARYNDNTDDITFGATVAGRQAPVPGVERMVGPVISTVPVRVKLPSQLPVTQYLSNVQAQGADMIPFEQTGLQNIARLGPDARDACGFTTLLVIQPQMIVRSIISTLFEHIDSTVPEDDSLSITRGYFTYPLVVQCQLGNDNVFLLMTFDPSVLCTEEIQRIAMQFEHVLQQLTSAEVRDDPAHVLGNITLCGPRDIEQVRSWNTDVQTEVVSSCFHTMVEVQAKKRPLAPAISAWDGEFSYSELNAAADRLAHHLVASMGVATGDLVILCFEKSAWAYVAMLAVNKAGGAWVPLDPSHPPRRHQQVISQAGARVALASPENVEKCGTMLSSVVEVSPLLDKTLMEKYGPDGGPPASSVSPRDAAYVLFTSGTTGTPKGIVMEHQSLCTSQTAISSRLGLEAEQVRMLQFAAYVFDLSIGEIIAPLISGACVCVPSEHDRVNDVTGYMRRAKVNWAFLTPSFVRLIKPEDVPDLELLLLAGEPVGNDHLATWAGKLRLLNGWGPSETCCFSTLQEWQTASESPMTVGRPVGGYCWIVEPNDYQQLAPVGCIGEVVIQGPTIAREYLAYPEGTAASFLTDAPAWAPRTDEEPYSRFYKSGDLAYYNPDGTIEFVSRQDTQVKIRGFRVELGDVEHHVRDSLDGVQQVVVDVLEAGERRGGPSLVAYLCFSTATRVFGANAADVTDEGDETDMLLPLDESASRQMSALVGSLSVQLPSYMVPTVYVPVKYMPSTTSQKTDRRRLRAAIDNVEDEEFSRYMLADAVKEAPTTDMETLMQKMWADVLALPVETIGRHDSFLQLGGDSIAVIRLVAAARERGIHLTVSLVFKDPRLSQVAQSSTASDEVSTEDLKPWSLVPENLCQSVERDIWEQCSLATRTACAVADAYPTTPLQEGLMTLAVKQPGSYMARYTFELVAGVDTEQFVLAWEQTVRACVALRTRIVLSGGSSWQAVLDDALEWGQTDNLTNYMALDSATPMQYGSALCRYALIPEGEHRIFCMTLHHAIFDGWSLGLIMRTLAQFYDGASGNQMALSPYVNFVRYAHDLDTSLASEYWREQLHSATRPVFPRAQAVSTARPSTPVASRSFSHEITFSGPSSASITRATVLRAAWAIVLARYNDAAEDITFGAAVAGRQAPIPGIGQMVGPVISTVPVRVKLTGTQLISQYLSNMQAQGAEMIPYEQTGLQNISKLSSDANEACGFTTLLVIQPRALFSGTDVSLLTAPSADVSAAVTAAADLTTYFTYPLVAQCHLSDDGVVLQLIYDPSILSAKVLEDMACQYEHVVQQLLSFQNRDAYNATLNDISICGPHDMNQILQWNANELSTFVVSACVHDLISEIVVRAPQQEAIFAWDGQCTYEELERMSNDLAAHLRELGVGVESLVPICFEKSMWTVVAMLAIMKAGGAFVPINPTNPLARRQALVSELKAPLMLTSVAQGGVCENMALPVVQVSASMVSHLPRSEADCRQTTTPANIAYVLFTSGSTGTPKGVVMEHRSLASSIRGHGKAFGISANSRVLQFSSYVFDVCLAEIFTTLAVGGSVCIPSDEDRLSNITDFIQQAQVNCAMLTPSFVQSFNAIDVPSLETLVLCGEAPKKSNLKAWHSRLTLMNGYGPAEACIFASAYEFQDVQASPVTIGRGCNTALWIAEPNNHDRLAPVGCVGELLIQGPTLAREYLNDSEKTARSFIESPSWLPPGPSKRLYKTGDLARFNDDGTIDYVGRKDVQIKIRGQRVEPGEVEYCIKKFLPIVTQVAVSFDPTPTRSTLVAFVQIDSQRSNDHCKVLGMNSSLRQAFVEVSEKLTAQLPAFMIPAYYIPLTRLPISTSGKVDGKFLQGILAELTTDEMTMYATEDRVEFREPTNAAESTLRSLWSQVLGVEEAEIGIDENFYRLGGDSIKIVTLVELIKRHYGVSMSRNLLNSNKTTICDMASFVTRAEARDEHSSLSPRVDLLAEFNELWKDVQQPDSHPDREWITSLAADANIFLTGGTGYLGTQILKHLVQHPQIAKVTVMVRADDISQGFARIERSARLARWWNEQYVQKIQVWIGDLSQLGFGLTHDQLRTLNGSMRSERIDAIIHNGASVEWTADYSALRPTNVDSTVQLLNVMLSSPSRPKMVYISGGVKADLTDRQAVAQPLSQAMGYIQTKFMSETLVQECMTHLPPSQNVLSIVKPGFIIGSLEQGVANTDDLIWRITAGAARIGAYPTESAEHWVFVSDVDAISCAILEQLTLDSPEPFVDIDTGVSVPAFWHTINSALDIPLQSVSWEQWKSMAHKDLSRAGESHPLWPVQQFLGQLGLARGTSRTMIELDTERVKTALRKNVAYLLDVGFIHDNFSHMNPEPNSIFTRSRRPLRKAISKHIS
nr:nonribosomal peptide synthetase easa [Quercus suber]